MADRPEGNRRRPFVAARSPVGGTLPFRPRHGRDHRVFPASILFAGATLPTVATTFTLADLATIRPGSG
jgi:hypothetical protein